MKTKLLAAAIACVVCSSCSSSPVQSSSSTQSSVAASVSSSSVVESTPSASASTDSSVSSSSSSQTPSSSASSLSSDGGLNLPVAKVSALYAADAQGILDSFYNIDLASIAPQLIGEQLEVYDGSLCTIMEEWCYASNVINFYHYQWDDAAQLLEEGVPFSDVLNKGNEANDRFYGEGLYFCLLLTADGETIAGEASYDDRDENWGLKYSFCYLPSTFLFIDDALMKNLQQQGLDTAHTIAKSVCMPGHSDGIYFTDGKTERYLLQQDNTGKTSYTLGKLYTMEELAHTFRTGNTLL